MRVGEFLLATRTAEMNARASRNGTQPPVGDSSGNGWLPIDAAELFASGLTAKPTEVLARNDGVNLFYSGELNALVGESESAKTWVTLLAAKQEIDKGNDVLFLDFEDSPGKTMLKLMQMGCTQVQLEKQFSYVQPDQAINSAIQERLRQMIRDPARNYALAVLDGVTEALALHSWDGNKMEDVAEFYRRVAKFIANLGPATVTIDHVPKSRDGRGSYAIGSQHKKAGITGAQYLVENVDRIARGKHGKSKLIVQKDKNGYVRELEGAEGLVGWLHVHSKPAGTSFDIDAWIDMPNLVVPTGKGIKASAADLKKITTAVAVAGSGISHSKLFGLVKGNKTAFDENVRWLCESGHLEDIGSATGHKYVCKRPYDELD